MARFRDGTAGEIDLERELHGPVFDPLRDPAIFKEFAIRPANGADFAPEFLHDDARVTA